MERKRNFSLVTILIVSYFIASFLGSYFFYPATFRLQTRAFRSYYLNIQAFIKQNGLVKTPSNQIPTSTPSPRPDFSVYPSPTSYSIPQSTGSVQKPVPTLTIVTLDQFALCLSNVGFTMYGIKSCPNCAAQKEDFGSSFRYVPYIDCDTNPVCSEKNIRAYPTWMDRNGKVYKGHIPLNMLSQLSGCAAPTQ